jgi:ABC-2 type transport system ATP-binding protein
LFGSDVATALPNVITRVGALVESPKLFPTFSGRLNLDLLAKIDGRTSLDIGRALETVDLADRSYDNFDTYSLGMKQRLAVAATLLKDPDLRILDEPSNGLDPAGIRAMRELIRTVGEAGTTVFVSSHILAEIELMCDSVAIIDRGQLITAGRVQDVIAARGQRVIVTIENQAAALDVLTRAGYAPSHGQQPSTIEVDGDSADPAKITQVLASEGLFLSGLRTEDVSLESVFLELTEGSE